MISLKDDISKFDKLVYNRQLGQFVAIDQMFVGSGVTIEAIIHQNSFIVEELKKMNAVFRNYCKLNQKVYNKIMQHELGVHSEQARLNGLTGSMQRKLQEALKIIKQLHQDAIRQHEKSTTFVGAALSPIKEELDTKVDNDTFAKRMKEVLEQYDDGGLQRDDGQSDWTIQNNGKRKKGKVGYDQFYKFKDQFERRMIQNQKQMQGMEQSELQMKHQLQKYQPLISRLQREVESHGTEIVQNKHDTLQQLKELKQAVSRVWTSLETRLSEETWQGKFTNYHITQVQPHLNEYESRITQQKIELKSLKQQLQQRLKQINTDGLKIREEVNSLLKGMEKRKEETTKLNDAQLDLQKKTDNEFRKLTTNLQNVTAQCKNHFTQLQKSLKDQTRNLNKQLTDLSLVIEQTVFKSMIKRFNTQFVNIDNEIKQNKLKSQNLQQTTQNITTELSNLKDILSHKANFSDFLQHVERKADKADFRDLQFRLDQTEHLITLTGNQTSNYNHLQRRDKRSRRKQNSITRLSKTLAMSSSKEKAKQPDSATKIFMCGMEGTLSDNRKIMSQNSRRRSLKSTGVVIHDFIL